MPTQAQRLNLREKPNQPPVMKQQWAGLGFFHWQVDPEIITARLPAGLHTDTFDGKAWLGIVPFFMRRVRPIALPPVPWLSWFLELNLRTYVHDDHGNPGVWFFSLDCNQPVAVEIARRLFHLPYQHAKMSATTTAKQITYHSRRKNDPRTATYQYPTATQTAPAEPGTLEWFLVERYLLYSTNPRGEIFQGRVHHHPYQIQKFTEPTLASTTPLALNHFPEPSHPPDSSLITAPVNVTIYPLRKSSRQFQTS